MNPLLLHPSRTSRNRKNDVSVYCAAKQRSAARDTSDWKDQRKAWVAEQRQRRGSSQQRVRGKHFDEDVLATGTRFSAFPRMVYALDRQERTLQTLDDGTAPARSDPSRGAHRSPPYPENSPAQERNALRRRLPVEVQGTYSFEVAPVTHSRMHQQPLHGRQRHIPHAQAVPPHAAPLYTSSSTFPPTQFRSGTAPERQDRDGIEVVLRDAADHPAAHHPPQQRAPRSQLADRTCPSRHQVHSRFPGLLRHSRRFRGDEQQALPPPPSSRLAAERGFPNASATPVASGRRYSVTGPLDRTSGHERWSAQPQYPPACLNSSHLMQEARSAKQLTPVQYEHESTRDSIVHKHADYVHTQQGMHQHETAASHPADALRQRLQPPLDAEWSEPPSRDVQDASDAQVPAGTAVASPGRVFAGSSSIKAPAAVWDTLSAENADLRVGSASCTPGGVWDNLFQLAEQSSMGELESSDIPAANTEHSDANSPQFSDVVADVVNCTAGVANPQESSPLTSASPQVHEHQLSTAAGGFVLESEAAPAGPQQLMVQKSEAPPAADSALFTAAGVAGASVFLLQSLSSRDKVLLQPPVSGDDCSEHRSQMSTITAPPVPAASMPEEPADMVEPLSAVPYSMSDTASFSEVVDTQLFLHSHSVPTLNTSDMLTDDVLSRRFDTRGQAAADDDMMSTRRPGGELVLTLECEDSALDSSEVLPKHGKMVLATPQMQAPQLQSSMWACTGTESRWQEQLPPKARQVMEFAQECSRVWHAVFPKKTEEQLHLESEIRKAVLSGDLHWTALNQVQQGKPIVPEQIAEAKRMAL